MRLTDCRSSADINTHFAGVNKSSNKITIDELIKPTAPRSILSRAVLSVTLGIINLITPKNRKPSNV
jgi:hypothetical protein